MSEQLLFTYGTLKSDQPEHSLHCAPPNSITPGRAAGSLWRLREGYPILEIEPECALLDASRSPTADWNHARGLSQYSKAHEEAAQWVEGELFAYPMNDQVFKQMDAWETFSYGTKGTYQRKIIWVKDERGRDRIAWAYVCYVPPNWATLVPESIWNPAREKSRG